MLLEMLLKAQMMMLLLMMVMMMVITLNYPVVPLKGAQGGKPKTAKTIPLIFFKGI